MAREKQTADIPILGIDQRPLQRQATPGLCTDIQNLRPYGPEDDPYWKAVPPATAQNYGGPYSDHIRSFYFDGYILALADDGADVMLRIIEEAGSGNVLHEKVLSFASAGSDSVDMTFADLGELASVSVILNGRPWKSYFFYIGDAGRGWFDVEDNTLDLLKAKGTIQVDANNIIPVKSEGEIEITANNLSGSKSSGSIEPTANNIPTGPSTSYIEVTSTDLASRPSTAQIDVFSNDIPAPTAASETVSILATVSEDPLACTEPQSNDQAFVLWDSIEYCFGMNTTMTKDQIAIAMANMVNNDITDLDATADTGPADPTVTFTHVNTGSQNNMEVISLSDGPTANDGMFSWYSEDLNGGTDGERTHSVTVGVNTTAGFIVNHDDTLEQIAGKYVSAINGDATISADWTASKVDNGDGTWGVKIESNVHDDSFNGTTFAVTSPDVSTSAGQSTVLGFDGTETHNIDIGENGTAGITIDEADSVEQIVDKYVAAINAEAGTSAEWVASKVDQGLGVWRCEFESIEHGTASNGETVQLSVSRSDGAASEVNFTVDSPTSGGFEDTSQHTIDIGGNTVNVTIGGLDSLSEIADKYVAAINGDATISADWTASNNGGICLIESNVFSTTLNGTVIAVTGHPDVSLTIDSPTAGGDDGEETHTINIGGNTVNATPAHDDTVNQIVDKYVAAINNDATINADWEASNDGAGVCLITAQSVGSSQNGTSIDVTGETDVSVSIVSPTSGGKDADRTHTIIVGGNETSDITVSDSDTVNQIVDKYVAAINNDATINADWEASNDGGGTCLITALVGGAFWNGKGIEVIGETEVVLTTNDTSGGGPETETHVLTIDTNSVLVTVSHGESLSKIVDRYMAAINGDGSISADWTASKVDNGDGTWRCLVESKESNSVWDGRDLSISDNTEVLVSVETPTVSFPRGLFVDADYPQLPIVQLFTEPTEESYTSAQLDNGTYEGLRPGLYAWRYAWRLNGGEHIMHSQPYVFPVYSIDDGGDEFLNTLRFYFDGFDQITKPDNLGFWERFIDGVTVFLTDKLGKHGSLEDDHGKYLEDAIFYEVGRFDFVQPENKMRSERRTDTFIGKDTEISNGQVVDIDFNSHHDVAGKVHFGYASRLFRTNTGTDFDLPRVSPFEYIYPFLFLVDEGASSITITILSNEDPKVKLFNTPFSVEQQSGLSNVSINSRNPIGTGDDTVYEVTADYTDSWSITLRYTGNHQKKFEVTISDADVDNDNYLADYGTVIPWDNFTEIVSNTQQVRLLVEIAPEEGKTFTRLSEQQTVYTAGADPDRWLVIGGAGYTTGVLWYPDQRAKKLKVYTGGDADVKASGEIDITSGSDAGLGNHASGVMSIDSVSGSSGEFDIRIDIGAGSVTIGPFTSAIATDQIAQAVAAEIDNNAAFSDWDGSVDGDSAEFEHIDEGSANNGVSYDLTVVNQTGDATASFSFPEGTTTAGGTDTVDITVSIDSGVLQKDIIVSVPSSQTAAEVETLIVDALNNDADFSTYYSASDGDPVSIVADEFGSKFNGLITFQFGSTGIEGSTNDLTGGDTEPTLQSTYWGRRSEKLNGTIFHLSDNFSGRIHDPSEGEPTTLSDSNTGRFFETNRIQVSEVGNPVNFRPERTYRVGGANDEITGLATNALPISEGQFGQYPVYVFLKHQIWLMEQSSDPDILFGRISPVGPDHGVDHESRIINIGREVVFMFKKKIYQLGRGDPQRISDPLDGLMDGSELLGYYNDGTYEELWVAAASKTYVFSLDHQRWFTLTRTIGEFLNADNTLWALDGSGNVVSQEELGSADVSVQFEFDNVHFGKPDQMKRIYALYVRGVLASPTVTLDFETSGAGPIAGSDMFVRPRAPSDYSFILKVEGIMTPGNGQYLHEVSAEFDTRYKKRRRATPQS